MLDHLFSMFSMNYQVLPFLVSCAAMPQSASPNYFPGMPVLVPRSSCPYYSPVTYFAAPHIYLSVRKCSICHACLQLKFPMLHLIVLSVYPGTVLLLDTSM